MKSLTRTLSRGMALLLIVAVAAMSPAYAWAKQQTPQVVHARILKRGVGNWVGVELLNGTAFVGRIVSVDDEAFGMQLHNDPGVTTVKYADVLDLHTGISKGAFWGLTIGGFAGVAAFAAVGIHMVHEHEQPLPAQPTTPGFPY
jgi:hypothetical protein